jgi:hypothetical protein
MTWDLRTVWGDIIKAIGRPHWVVNTLGDMGFRIFGVNFCYYRRPYPAHDGRTPFRWRVARYDEFGQVIRATKEKAGEFVCIQSTDDRMVYMAHAGNLTFTITRYEAKHLDDSLRVTDGGIIFLDTLPKP